MDMPKDNLAVLFEKASALRAAGEAEAAIHLLKRIMELAPQSAAVPSNLGNALSDLGRYAEAEAHYRRALEINPSFSEASVNLGLTLIARGDLTCAESVIKEALSLAPENPVLNLNLGGVYLKMGELEKALGRFDKALEFAPDNCAALYNRGCALELLGCFGEAKQMLNQVVSCAPDDRDAVAQLFHILQKTCSWEEMEQVEARMEEQTVKALADGERPGETPFMSIARSAHPERNLEVAKAWSTEMVDKLAPIRQRVSFNQSGFHGGKLRIGYLSGNFYDHPTAHNTAGLYGKHNRDVFEVFAYSFGPDDGSPHRQAITASCDRFVDVAGLNDGEAAERINRDGIDILIALTGHTDGSRLEICALRPAPLQVGYLSYPGTCGGDFLDYVLVDDIVCPASDVPFFTEAPAYLEGTYWPTDNEQAVGPQLLSRASQGLPENALVFCCFCQTYKIDRQMFSVWMSLLHQIQGSVLWLFGHNREAEKNLKAQARAAGIEDNRLIFADKLSKPEHLARIALADLALDTRIYTGHTTTTDALWAGIPVVAIAGSHFASRVSESLLCSHGLEELIASDLEAYENLVLEIVEDIGRLRKLKYRVVENRKTHPLFDTTAKVRNLETLYLTMWKHYGEGLRPGPIGKGGS